MSKLDFAAINAALSIETCVKSWLSDGKKVGGEWVARNPTRSDANPGSFTVNLKTGKWGDFATGEVGGDLVSLYAYLFHAGDQGAAARALAEGHNIEVTPQVREQVAGNVRNIADSQPKPKFPIPVGVAPPDFKHGKFGQPSAVYTYRSADGRPLMYVVRYEPAGMRKQILPMSWCTEPDGTERWRWRGITGQAKRPLYGLDRLAARPDADVLVVEGEKCADAVQDIVGDDFAVVAWLGGVETADRVNLRALAGRRVILCPDMDAQRQRLTKDDEAAGLIGADKPLLPIYEQPAIRAMMDIAAGCKGVASEVLLCRYAMGEQPSGWDLADGIEEGMTGADVLAWIKSRACDPQTALRAEPYSAPADAPPAALPAEAVAKGLPLSEGINLYGFPHLSDKGQPQDTKENMAYLLNEYAISARYNVMKKNVFIDVPGRNYHPDNQGNNSLDDIDSLCARNRMPRGSLVSRIRNIADDHRYSPVCDWIESKRWDGKSRLADLFATVQADGDQMLKDALIRRWLISAIAAAFTPESGPNLFAAHGVLVFTGPQGTGKTSWVKALAPPSLNAILEGAMVDPSNKDSVINAVSHWIVELGELDATFRKADVARLKAFVTSSVDKVRRPYDRIESEYPRRTVFFASVNESRYLIDDTGNRRWWTVPVTTINYQHRLDVQQIWAEVLTLYRAGEQWWLTPEENAALAGVNAEHETVDPIYERIQALFAWGRPHTRHAMTATEVLLAIGHDKPNRAQSTNATAILQKLTGKKSRKIDGRRVYDLPPKMSEIADDTIPF